MMIVIMMNMMCGVVTRSTMNNGATVLSTNLGGFRWNDIFWLLLAFFNSLSETVSLQPLHVVTDLIVFWRWQTLGQKIFWRSIFWFYYCLSPVVSLPLHAEVNYLNSNIYTGTQSWGISKWRSWKKWPSKKTVFLWYFSFGIFHLRQNCHVICYKNINCAFSLSSGFVEVGGNKFVLREDRTGDECQDYYDNCFYKKDGELYT